MFIGLSLMSMISSLLNNIFSSSTLPLSASVSYLPTPLPSTGAPLSCFDAKTGEFERFVSIYAQSGYWVVNSTVVLLRNNKVIHYGIQSACHRKSQLNPISLKINLKPAKNVQIHTKNIEKVCKSCVFRLFSLRTYYVEENKPFVSITSA